MISNQGWIKVPRCGYGENGLLFEELLGIKRNDFSIPDYNGIEIKVQSKYSNYPITLFSLMLDGPEPLALQSFVSRYGAYDNLYANSKVLYITLNTKDYTFWGKTLKMRLFFDRKKQRLYIHVVHSNGKTIELKSYWELSSLYAALTRKVNKLCIIRSETNFFDSSKYIKYTEMNLFTLKSFESFKNALCDGIVSVKIKYGVYKKGPRAGSPYNHGIAFQISYSNLEKIFNKIL